MNHKAKAAPPRWMISIAAAAAATICLANLALAKPEKQVAPDPGRTTPVHNIPLFGAEGGAIDPAAESAKPISQKVTCGKCHDYEIIERG
ncbi:MAG: hypothetical protein E4H48_07255, partial [Syntrophobacterales bacterium]